MFDNSESTVPDTGRREVCQFPEGVDSISSRAVCGQQGTVEVIVCVCVCEGMGVGGGGGS